MLLFLFVCFVCTAVLADRCSTRRDYKPRQNAPNAYYDYVFVGGGTAACAAAARLAEDKSVNILIIEQGGDLADGAQNAVYIQEYFDAPYCDPFIYPVMNGTCSGTYVPFHIADTPLNALYAAKCDAGQQFRVTPQLWSGKKEMTYPRGGVLGGSSVVNFMIAARGNPYDFDSLWTKQEGLEGWNYSNVLPYFLKSETASDGVLNTTFHGTSGPVCLTNPKRFWRSDMWEAIKTAGQSQGFPLVNDFMDPSGFYGIGDLLQTVCPNGRRSSARSYISRLEALGQVCYGLYPQCGSSTNLHILLNRTVTQILFDQSTPRRAYGVQYVNSHTNPYIARTWHPAFPLSEREATKMRADWNVWTTCPVPSPLGAFNTLSDTFQTTDTSKWSIFPEDPSLLAVTSIVEAKREVILAAGNVVTPQLLMLSGIGPKAHLDALQIPVIADLPVGQNLEDHDQYLMTWKHNNASNIYWNPSDTFTHAGSWLVNGNGPFASNHIVGSLDIARNGSIPDTHNAWITFYAEELDDMVYRIHDSRKTPRSIPEILSWTGVQYSSWLVETAHRSCAKGKVLLKNRNPLQSPFVDVGLGACKDVVDSLIFATRQIRKIMAALPPAFQATEIFPGAAVTSDTDLEHYIRHALFGDHMCCSSPMGPCTSPRSVEDSEGRVYMVSGLRVVDISNWPTIVTANPWLDTIMVAEKLADNIKAQYRGLHGHVFNDIDGDGQQSETEGNVVNVTVTITSASDSSVVGKTTKTNSLGEFFFDVNGTVTVSFSVPATFQAVPGVKSSSMSIPSQTYLVPTTGVQASSVPIRSAYSTSSSLSDGAIAGIVVGCVLGAAILVVLIILLVRRW